MGIVVIVCLGLVFISFQFSNKYQHFNETAQYGLIDIRTKYETAKVEKQLVQRYLPEYKRLKQRGIVGKENRLHWIDTLRKVKEKTKVLEMQYEIKPQQIYSEESFQGMENFQLVYSDVTLNMELLHEGDLLNVLRELNSQADGLFNIKECQLLRKSQTIVFDAKQPNITATCKLHWYTFQPLENS